MPGQMAAKQRIEATGRDATENILQPQLNTLNIRQYTRRLEAVFYAPAASRPHAWLPHAGYVTPRQKFTSYVVLHTSQANRIRANSRRHEPMPHNSELHARRHWRGLVIMIAFVLPVRRSAEWRH